MAKPISRKFKYNINHQLDLLPRSLKIKDLVKHLTSLGVSQDVFYSDRAILHGSRKSIPSDRLIIYSKVFECSTEDLLNHNIKAKSIRQVMNRATN